MSVIENHLIFMNLDMKTACERCLTTTITRATHPPLASRSDHDAIEDIQICLSLFVPYSWIFH